MTSLPAKPFSWRGSLKHILVATDFSDNATAALEWAVELAKTHRAQMTVVHSVRPEHPYEAMPESALMDNIATELESAVKLPKRWGLEAQGEAPPGKPWEVIPKLARTMGIDLVVIGARGRSKLSSRLLGSTADRIIRSSSTPVLVVHEGGESLPHGIRTVLAAIDFSDESAIALQAGLQVVHESREPLHIVLLHAAVIEGPLPGPRHVLPMPRSGRTSKKKSPNLLRHGPRPCEPTASRLKSRQCAAIRATSSSRKPRERVRKWSRSARSGAPVWDDSSWAVSPSTFCNMPRVQS